MIGSTSINYGITTTLAVDLIGYLNPANKSHMQYVTLN